MVGYSVVCVICVTAPSINEISSQAYGRSLRSGSRHEIRKRRFALWLQYCNCVAGCSRVFACCDSQRRIYCLGKRRALPYAVSSNLNGSGLNTTHSSSVTRYGNSEIRKVPVQRTDILADIHRLETTCFLRVPVLRAYCRVLYESLRSKRTRRLCTTASELQARAWSVGKQLWGMRILKNYCTVELETLGETSPSVWEITKGITDNFAQYNTHTRWLDRSIVYSRRSSWQKKG
jgi:hypothetical protein